MFTARRTDAPRRHTRPHLTLLATISLATALITAFAGSVQAAPANAAPTTYDVSVGAGSFSLTVHNGSISTNSGALVIRNSAGAEKFRMPLAYRKEYQQFPIDARNVGNTATLIPSRNVARSTPVNPIEVEGLRTLAAAQKADAPQTKQERDDQALARFNQMASAGLTISSLVGLVLGAVVGGVIGCLTGLIAAIVGCLPAIPLGASLGSIAGLSIGGGGSVIGAAIQYFNTINSPFVPPRR
ncbi:glycine zipper family protein [Gordonia hankookensis]|uniref:Glycine zipper family protein n=1 Tax=Gordonia hankookensis TaxID=589403 RepID=A0ABR7W8S5_9ACTN|nr:glycine zipper family protein [Gordonia hankookensis]MBD1319222.1 glycine zipper family protein [Gordonia hankookensis]